MRLAVGTGRLFIVEITKRHCLRIDPKRGRLGLRAGVERFAGRLREDFSLKLCATAPGGIANSPYSPANGWARTA